LYFFYFFFLIYNAIVIYYYYTKEHVKEYELKNPIIYKFSFSKTNNVPTLLELMLEQAYSLARNPKVALANRCLFIACTGVLGAN
jgi:hypothetical protein